MYYQDPQLVPPGPQGNPQQFYDSSNIQAVAVYGDDEMEEEESLAERELSEDAQWKIIQKNTFTRWANEQLKKANKQLTDLGTDLSDGLRLTALVEVLSNHQFRHVNKRPHFRTQKLENVTQVLRFLEEEEGIRLVNIDSSDLVDGKMKLILGLIWTLILHYSIALPIWEGEEQPPPQQGQPTPKNRLLGWINQKMPDKPVGNFTGDWNDGTAIGALVDACAPGLCPDWDTWDPKNKFNNAKEAMDSAEQWLGVPQLIRPEEMVDPRVDEKAMMTYLAQYPNAKLREGAPLRPKANPARVRAYGPGLEPVGNSVGAPARFTVETYSAGKGQLDVVVLNPRGRPEPCDVVPNNDAKQTYACVYTPTIEGEYRVIIKYNGREIPRSPFAVKVEGPAGDARRVTATGPGILRTGNVVGKRTNFEIYTRDAGQGTVDVAIVDPHGNREAVRPRIVRQPGDQSTYLAEYTPREEGLHQVHVWFAGQPIPSSPFPVGVAPTLDPASIYATGRGIQPKGVRVKDLADFTVHTENASGPVDVTVQVVGPGNEEVKCRVMRQDSKFQCSYVPQRAGTHTVNVLAGAPGALPAAATALPPTGAAHIARSPFRVEVGRPLPESRIRAFGPGLHGGVVGQPAWFTVDTNGDDTPTLKFFIEGPDEAKIDCFDRGDGSVDVAYWPKAPGEYAVHVTTNDEDILNSPYMAQIVPAAAANFDPTLVSAEGPGLAPHGVQPNANADFTIDTRRVGQPPGRVPVQAVCYEANAPAGQPLEIPVQVVDNRDGTLWARYVPRRPGKHIVYVTYGGLNIRDSPFRVQVAEPLRPDLVRVFGPGLEKAVRNAPTYFVVDPRAAGPGQVRVQMMDERRQPIPAEVARNEDGTQTVNYTPRSIGTFTASVAYGAPEGGAAAGPSAGGPVPGSPFSISVHPDVDVSKIYVEGLEPTVECGEEKEFDIITTKGAGGTKVRPSVLIQTPSGRYIEPAVEETVDGFAPRYVLGEPGAHAIHVNYLGKPIAGSPFTQTATAKPLQISARAAGQEGAGAQPNANVAPPAQVTSKTPQVGKVRVSGDGLKRAVTGRPAQFTVDMRESGAAPLGIRIEGPTEARIECRDNGNGTCTCEYVASEPGLYSIHVLYNEQPVAGSPFGAQVFVAGRENLDVGRVRVYGPGIEPTGVFLESITEFIADARAIDQRGDGKVKAIIQTPSGAKLAAQVDNKHDGTYRCAYTPLERGAHQIDVTYDGVPVPQSPFAVVVSPGFDAARVKAYGPGLQGGLTGDQATFTIETKGAGQGALGLTVEGPSEAKMTCRDNRDGSCQVEYLPTKSGIYEIAIRFADRPIPGSPFSVPIRDRVDSNRVRVFGPGIEGPVRAKKPARFTVDATGAGQAPLEVTYADKFGHKKAADIRTHGDGTFDVIYYPESDGPHTVDVRYAGSPVQRSPFVVPVGLAFDPAAVRVSGEGISGTVLSSLPTQFAVDTRDAGDADLNIRILNPDGQAIRPNMTVNPDNTYAVQYTPEDVGQYAVQVNFGGQPVPNSPFPVRAVQTGNAAKVVVRQAAESVPLGEEAQITLDTSAAGRGACTCHIRQPNGGEADLDIEDNADGTVSLFYTPRIPGTYSVEIKFGGVVIPQSPLQQRAGEELINAQRMSRVEGAAPQFVSSELYYPVDFRLPVDAAAVGRDAIQAEILTPSNVHVPPLVIDNKDGTVTIKYQPTEKGMHELHVRYKERPIPGSPFKFYVDTLGTGHVSAYGPGLTHGRCGEPAEFVLVTKDAGTGGLAIAVEGPSKAEIKCTDQRDGTCLCSYTPSLPGEYVVSIKFQDRHIAGSPFTARVVGEARRRAQLTMGATGHGEIALPFSGAAISELDMANLVATVRSPSGREEQCILKRTPQGHLGVSFTPREVGEHLVSVFRGGKHIANSPFKINVGEQEIADARRVRVFGAGLERAAARQPNQFVVDTRAAGYGGLSLSVEGPSKADLDCADSADGTCLITYVPTEPGTYLINIKYAEEHVPGSPFTVHVTGEASSGRLLQEVTRRREATEVREVGKPCELSLKIPGMNVPEMRAVVRSPSGLSEPAEIVQVAANEYSISFVPHELGSHLVDVLHRGRHIPGSPFQFTVGPITEGGANKVRAVGAGLETARVQQPAEFVIYSREAGAGGLTIAVEGPSKAEIDFQDRRDGSCLVSYRVAEPGEYQVAIKFNDEHIIGSPYTVLVAPDEADLKRISVMPILTASEKDIPLGKPVAFTVNLPSAAGKLRAVVEAPSGSEDEAAVQELERGQYAVRFVPRESGAHLIHVLQHDPSDATSATERHVPGSPFRIVVGGRYELADPSLVHAVGEGLVRGQVGQRAKFLVNTLNAGAGALSVVVEGPSKVQLTCSECDEGYEFSYLPSAPGDYLITIKFGGNFHIVGSPFRAHVTGPGGRPVSGLMGASVAMEESSVVLETSTKQSTSGSAVASSRLLALQRSPAARTDLVAAQGLGLKLAQVGRPASFTVDASTLGAGGANMLLIGALGPTAPAEEVLVKHVGNRRYLVTYTVRERGQHVLVVKWGDQHVPGSPFLIDVI